MSLEAVSGYVGSGEVVSCSSLLWMGMRGGELLSVLLLLMSAVWMDFLVALAWMDFLVALAVEKLSLCCSL